MSICPAPQPPFSAELLADLHADNLDPELTSQLWPLVRADPAALEVIEALDAVTAKLGELGRDHELAIPIPADVAAGIERALAAEGDPRAVADTTQAAQGASGAVTTLEAARARRARRFGSRTGLLAAAALAVVAGATGLVFGLRGQHPSSTVTAQPPTSGTGPAVEFSAQSVALVISGHTTTHGALSEPAAMHACLAAIHADRPLIGSIDARYHGRDAVLIVVRSTHPRQVTALVVSPRCGPADPQVFVSRDF
jgi:hypothetical protein